VDFGFIFLMHLSSFNYQVNMLLLIFEGV